MNIYFAILIIYAGPPLTQKFMRLHVVCLFFVFFASFVQQDKLLNLKITS